MDPRIHGSVDSWIWIPGFTDSWIHRFLGSKILWFLDFCSTLYLTISFIIYMDFDCDVDSWAWVHGFMNTDSRAWIHGSKCKDSYILDLKQQKIIYSFHWYLCFDICRKIFIIFTLDLDSDMDLWACIHGSMDTDSWIHVHWSMDPSAKIQIYWIQNQKSITIFLLLTLFFAVWYSIV